MKRGLARYGVAQRRVMLPLRRHMPRRRSLPGVARSYCTEHNKHRIDDAATAAMMSRYLPRFDDTTISRRFAPLPLHLHKRFTPADTRRLRI